MAPCHGRNSVDYVGDHCSAADVRLVDAGLDAQTFGSHPRRASVPHQV
jgi:hypothetical protein